MYTESLIDKTYHDYEKIYVLPPSSISWQFVYTIP